MFEDPTVPDHVPTKDNGIPALVLLEDGIELDVDEVVVDVEMVLLDDGFQTLLDF